MSESVKMHLTVEAVDVHVPDKLLAIVVMRNGERVEIPATLIPSAPQQPQPAPIGALVSVDVSTGDHDAGNRIFARITSAMNGSLGEIEYLAEEESRNFAQPAAVEGVTWKELRELAELAATPADICDHDFSGNPITHYDVMITGAYSPFVLRLVNLAIKRFANPSAVVAIPEGMALVPIMPTDAMLEAVVKRDCDGMPISYRTIYLTMLSAAQSQGNANTNSDNAA